MRHVGDFFRDVGGEPIRGHSGFDDCDREPSIRNHLIHQSFLYATLEHVSALFADTKTFTDFFPSLPFLLKEVGEEDKVFTASNQLGRFKK